jgi:hypothetical protein
MTTRKQRECLIRLDQVDDVFSDEVCRGWTDVLPRRRRAMPADLPSAVRVRIRAYLEMARDPSGGEINAAAELLHRQLVKAIEADDWDAAAVALEKVPEPIRAELDRLTPGGIPTPDPLHDPQYGIERAKELLGCCIAGAEIVPGRERANGRRSRPSLQLRPRFKQARGFPRQEAEAMLVRALAEYYRSLHNGRFPRSWTRDPAKQWSPFECLVGHVLRGCGVSGISPLDLVRRALNEIRDAEGCQ